MNAATFLDAAFEQETAEYVRMTTPTGRTVVDPLEILSMKRHLLAHDDASTRRRPGPKRKTHCKRGHEFTNENTRLTSKGRACRACDRLWDAKRHRG